MKKASTPQEKRYMGKVAQLGCIKCFNNFVEIHHITTLRGYGARSSNYDVLPLCFAHHRGIVGIHTIGVKKWEANYGIQTNLLKQVKALIYKNILEDIAPKYEAKKLGLNIKDIEDFILSFSLIL